MPDNSRVYAIHSDEECLRLERQAVIADINGHLKYLDMPPQARVLDAGCGSGSMSRLIARSFPDATVTGLDFRQQYIDFAKMQATVEHLSNVTFQQGDVFALPFADATFDVVWTKYLLQWLKEPTLALAEMKRVTKPGGHIISCDFDGFVVEHFPITPDFDTQVRRVMAAIVDTHTGRKVAPMLMALGCVDVKVDVESDKVFTVIGKIDLERRENWVAQWRAGHPHLVKIVGSEAAADRFIADFMAVGDDPTTATLTTLYFTRGRVPA